MSTSIENIDTILPKSYSYRGTEPGVFHILTSQNGGKSITLPKGVYHVSVSWNGSSECAVQTAPIGANSSFRALTLPGVASVDQGQTTGMVTVASDDGTGRIHFSATITAAELSANNVRAKVTITPLGVSA